MTPKQLFSACLILVTFCTLKSSAQMTTIENPRIAPIQRTIQMEEIWRVGDDPDEDFVLGVIRKVISDEQGNFYLLDTQQREVFKFSPDGQYLKSVVRRGEGPGEIGRCYFFDFWDKNTIACFSGFPHKFVKVDLDGLPLGSMSPTPGQDHSDNGRIAMSSFSRRDGFLVIRGSFHLFEEGKNVQHSFLSALDENGQEAFCYSFLLSGYDFTKPEIVVDDDAEFQPYRIWTLGLNGEVYNVPSRTDYLIEVHDAQGTLLRQFQRIHPKEKRTDEDKEIVKNRYSFGVGQGREMPEISYKISDHATAVVSLNWIDDQLWVRSSAGVKKSAADGTYIVDVFDSAGHLLEERTYQLPMDRDNDLIFWLDHGRAAVIKNFKSAKVASRGNDVTVQIGDGTQDQDLSDAAILEVILYQIK